MDTDNHRVTQFTPAGEFERKWSAYFSEGVGIDWDGADYLYVADRYWGEISKHAASDSAQVTTWGGGTTFSNLADVAVDRSGSGLVYAADAGNNRVQVFSTELAFCGKRGSIGTGDLQFANRPESRLTERGTSMSRTRITGGCVSSGPPAPLLL